MSELDLWRLNRVEYSDGLRLQEILAAEVGAGRRRDTLLLLEHDHVLTLGRGANGANVLIPPEELARRGVELFETGRGGDVTYHGPGQLVGYPLLDLGRSRQGKDVRKYVRGVEEVMIRACARFGITAERAPGMTGVWVGKEKVGAIGVRISRWVTSHGFALNVSTDLSYFDLIVPCGIRDRGVTSLSRLLGRTVSMAEAEEAAEEAFAEVFQLRPVHRELPPATVAVVIQERDATLCLHRTPDRGGFWQILTGRVEAGESLPAAATRELAEETGIESPVESLGYQHAFALERTGSPPAVAREVVFEAQAPSRRVVLSEEHDEARWLPPSEAASLVKHAGHRKAVLRAAAPRSLEAPA